uniref:Uncharacterized protein n=1 Tax=Chromera velia CCMP2878 TaxID=1169474 RepID=A0A0G4GY28_9ALVE|eukprot:Cvel_784.t1-p1 / transcript=Cvel_784.t1 / gene=Cvel_784 / organism=Chromera_velia_CCMP2878 / gene_product=hypothetical protein / transcript_product=hypothetical protein / location=Cvel_scaffold24:111997-124322(-) / protein_length=410 / sequence_SO=supercontig / SO=protein_coding / is_pseudo=false
MEAKKMLKRKVKLLEVEMTEWTVRDTIERVEKMGLGEELRKIERQRTKREHARKALSESDILRKNKFWALSEEGEEMERERCEERLSCLKEGHAPEEVKFGSLMFIAVALNARTVPASLAQNPTLIGTAKGISSLPALKGALGEGKPLSLRCLHGDLRGGAEGEQGGEGGAAADRDESRLESGVSGAKDKEDKHADPDTFPVWLVYHESLLSYLSCLDKDFLLIFKDECESRLSPQYQQQQRVQTRQQTHRETTPVPPVVAQGGSSGGGGNGNGNGSTSSSSHGGNVNSSSSISQGGNGKTSSVPIPPADETLQQKQKNFGRNDQTPSTHLSAPSRPQPCLYCPSLAPQNSADSPFHLYADTHPPHPIMRSLSPPSSSGAHLPSTPFFKTCFPHSTHQSASGSDVEAHIR